MTQALGLARNQSTADQAVIANLENKVLAYQQNLYQAQARLQEKIDEFNTISAQNRKLQSEYATAKLKLDHEREVNCRARLAFDTSITSREMSAQLDLLADAGTPAPKFFQGLLEARQKALAEANNRAQKAEVGRATAEAVAKEEDRKSKLLMENMKAQMQEYQQQIDMLKRQVHHPPWSNATSPTANENNNNNRKRQAPPPWQFFAETEEAAGIRPVNPPKKQQKQQPRTNPNFLGGTGAIPRPNKPNTIRILPSRTIGVGGLATKANPRAALELEAEIEGLIGPSSELPSMHPYASNMMPPPPPRERNPPAPAAAAAAAEPTAPDPVAVEAEEAAVEEPQAAAGDVNEGAGPSAAAAEKEHRSKVLEFRERLLKRKQAEAGGAPVHLAVDAPPPPALPTSNALVENNNNNNSNPGVEWGTEVERAAANVDEDDDVIELISDDSEDDEDEEQEPAAAAADGVENNPPAHNNSHPQQQFQQQFHQQQRALPPPSKATIALLAAGPSKIGLAGAPGTSFIRNPKSATTGLKDDAAYIQYGPDGKGGRITIINDRNGRNNNSNRVAPAWGGTLTDHVRENNNGGGNKRAKGGGAAKSKPINQYFGPK
jgi:hypothetical protein